MSYIEKTFSYISKTQIYGILPLDLLAHFLIGTMITLLLLKVTKNNIVLTFFLVFLIEIIKEFYDSTTMTATIEEAVKDIIATLIFPLLLILIRKMNKRPLTGSRGYFR